MGVTDVDEEGRDRRRLAFLLVIVLVLLGTGVGTVVFTGPSAPPASNESTPTPTPTATATPTGTPGGGGPRSTPTSTPTGTPVERTPTTAPTPTVTPTDGTGGGGGGSDDGSDGGGAEPTPSPGLELGDDGPFLSTSDVYPGQSGQGTLTLRNAEDKAGNLTISAVEITDEENGITDPESKVDFSPAEGELSEHLEVRVSVENQAGDRTYLLGTDDGYVTLENLPANVSSDRYRLASGETVTLIVDWQLPSSTGNEVQSDGVVMDVGLALSSND